MKFLRGLPERVRLLALVVILAILCAATTGAASIAAAALAFCAVAAVAFVWMVSTLIRDLQRSRERLAFALEAGEIGFYDWDLRTDRAICSAQYRRLLGLDPAAAMPSMTERLSGVHSEDLPRVQSALAATMDSGAPYDLEYRISLPDGGFRWVHSKGMGFARPGAKPQRVIGVLQDITARKAAEAALRNAHADLERRVDQQAAELGEASRALAAEEARYHMLFTRMLDGFALHEMVCDEAGRPQDYRFLEVNPAFERLTGIRACDAVGRRATEVIPGLEQSWIERYGHVAASGEPIRFESYSQPLGRHFEVVAFSPGQGLFATIFADISRRKEAEEELRRKNRDLETLLYVTSHDLREPLRSIRNFSQLVSDRYGAVLDDKGRDFLRRVVLGGERMERLIDDVLQLSRAQRTIKPEETVDSREIVQEALQSLEATIRERGAEIRVAGDLPRFRGDRQWVTRAVLNLIANALKFTREGEPPEIEIAAYRPDADGQAGIAVRDRGPGVNPEYGERIFGLFQRAVAREVPGTGAGLAIVREVAEKHGGRAWVQPREGGGSEFVITFGQGSGEAPDPSADAVGTQTAGV